MSNNLRAKPNLTIQTSKPLAPFELLPIFALSVQSQDLSQSRSTSKSIPSPALDTQPCLITFALAPTTPDLKCPSLRSGYILLVTPPGFLPPDPPFSSISFSPAQFIARPNPNKALASVKQGALHKKVMSASNADRRHSVLRAFDRVRWCTRAWMCECCVCVSL